MVHKLLAESHDDDHAQLAFLHVIKACNDGPHKRSHFDIGLMFEEGFGTLVDQTNAYVAYIAGCEARDERAIDRVRELRAEASVDFLLAVHEAFEVFVYTEESVRGNETLEALRELILGNFP